MAACGAATASSARLLHLLDVLLTVGRGLRRLLTIAVLYFAVPFTSPLPALARLLSLQ